MVASKDIEYLLSKDFNISSKQVNCISSIVIFRDRQSVTS